MASSAAEVSVVVVMPAFNEEGISGFVAEIDECLRPAVKSLAFVIIDDASTTPVSELVPALRLKMSTPVSILRNAVNQGHGPSAMKAYANGLDRRPDVVLHVDGDGQFDPREMVRIVNAAALYGAALGIRHSRSDPWFRKVISRVARAAVGESSGDVNTPLRAYRVAQLRSLLSAVPPHSLVPHLRFGLLHARLGIRPAAIAVTSRPRRGASKAGTSWGNCDRQVIPSMRLLEFSIKALVEVVGARARNRLLAPEQLGDLASL